jgi:hypothetical protein
VTALGGAAIRYPRDAPLPTSNVRVVVRPSRVQGRARSREIAEGIREQAGVRCKY